MQPKITKQNQGEYAIEGEINKHTVPGISKELLALIPSVEGANITFDLSQVSRSDSAGVALLVEIMQLTKTANLSLHLSNLPQQMQDIAGVSGLLDILPIIKN